MLGLASGDDDFLAIFGGYCRTASRIGIDVTLMLWPDREMTVERLELANVARMAQASLSGWDEINAYAKAEAESKAKSGRR